MYREADNLASPAVMPMPAQVVGALQNRRPPPPTDPTKHFLRLLRKNACKAHLFGV
jgi:hypothetical protein